MALKFVPFSSQLELPFYSALFTSKLEHDKLDDSARSLVGLYEPRAEKEPNQSARMQIHANALTSHKYVSKHSYLGQDQGTYIRDSVPLGMIRAEGILKNFNTLEALTGTDRSAILQTAGRQVGNILGLLFDGD